MKNCTETQTLYLFICAAILVIVIFLCYRMNQSNREKFTLIPSNCGKIENCYNGGSPTDERITGLAHSTTPGELFPWYVDQVSTQNCAPQGSIYKRLGQIPWCNPPLDHYEECNKATQNSLKNY